MVWRYGAFVMLIEFVFNFVALERLYYIPDSFIENFNTAKVMNYIYNRYSFIHSNKGGSVGPFYYLNLMIKTLYVMKLSYDKLVKLHTRSRTSSRHQTLQVYVAIMA